MSWTAPAWHRLRDQPSRRRRPNPQGLRGPLPDRSPPRRNPVPKAGDPMGRRRPPPALTASTATTLPT